jgi:hypothetical protein
VPICPSQQLRDTIENIAGKIFRAEPVVNPDHTLYFNTRTLKVLLRKNGLQVEAMGYLDDSDAYTYKRSVKKRIFDMIEKLLRLLTPKFMGGLVVVASSDNSLRIAGTRDEIE